jgi:tetratricopeptide (TPR) repeat protein
MAALPKYESTEDLPRPANDMSASAPQTWAERVAAAKLLLDTGDLVAAEAAYQALRETDPGNLDGYVGLSRCARKRGDHAASLAIFAAARALYPDHLGVLLEHAIDLQRLGEIEAAAAEFLAVLARDPDNLHAKRCLAGVKVAQAGLALAAQDFDHAVSLYAGAAALRRDQITAGLDAVDRLIAIGRQAEALPRLAELETTHGPLTEIVARRMNVLRESGQVREALALGREVTAWQPNSFWLWLERCKAELVLGTDAEIATCLAQMPATIPAEHALVHQLAGHAAANDWRIEPAIAHYEAAAALRPDSADIQNDLIRCRLLLMDVAGARRHLAHYQRLTAVPGETRNSSQTHYGQVVDDFGMDERLADGIAALQGLAPADRLVALRVMVQDHPESTVAAVAAMIAWRRGGVFDRPVPAAADAAIPKTIMQFWPRSKKPAEVAAAMRSWRPGNKGYQFVEFDHATAEQWLVANLPPAVPAAYRRTREAGQKADIFRLAWLVAHGGVYADVHDRCLAPLSSLVPATADFVVYQEDLGTLGTNFIAARPRHPVLAEALRQAVNAANRGDADIGWLSTGPALLTRVFVQTEMARAAWPNLSAGTLVHSRRTLFQSVAVYCAAGYLRDPAA